MQVEKLSARCPLTARKPPGNPSQTTVSQLGHLASGVVIGQLHSDYCCFALARGFGRRCAASSDERAAPDTHASDSSEANKLDATDSNYRRQADVPAAVDGAWYIALLCQILVCGVHVLDGYEPLHDEFNENADTEARNARCPHVHRRATLWCRLQHTGAGSETREINEVDPAGRSSGSQKVTFVFHAKNNPSHDGP